MKNTAKFLTVLLCTGMLLSLAACGGGNGPADTAGDGTVTAAEKQTGSGGDDIVLPEDGKIPFGKKDTQPTDTTEEVPVSSGTETQTEAAGDGETAADEGEKTEAGPSSTADSTEGTSAPAEGTEAPGGTSSAPAESAGPSDDTSWGGIVWN